MAVTTPAVSMYVGEDKSIVDTIYEDDGTTAQDITGWQIRATLLQEIPSLVSLVVKDNVTAGGLVLTAPSSGIMTITFASVDTVDITPGLYRFRVERINSGADTVLTLVPFNLLQK